MDLFIKEIQQALLGFGYQTGPIDGIYGPQTKAAILAFQRDQGLATDGLVGPLTQGLLFGVSKVNEARDNQQLTAHFNREEFRCCCGGLYCDGFPVEMDSDLLARLEAVRRDLNSPIIVTSGVRCSRRNAEVGGISQSKHLRGYAVDCYAPAFSVDHLARIARQEGLGVLIYQAQGFCHLEI